MFPVKASSHCWTVPPRNGASPRKTVGELKAKLVLVHGDLLALIIDLVSTMRRGSYRGPLAVKTRLVIYPFHE